MVHVAGTLTFSRDKSTRLDVGLLKIQPGEEASEDGFVCAVHDSAVKQEKREPAPARPDSATDAGTRAPDAPPPALEVGTADDPIPAGVTATIRLVAFPGADPEITARDHRLRRADGLPRRTAEPDLGQARPARQGGRRHPDAGRAGRPAGGRATG